MSGTRKFQAGEGDWICADPKCGNINFSRRGQCNKCGKTEKSEGQDMKKGGSEIGKAMAEKSRGLFSADDWQCKTCGNVNWARRMECNMCNTPKFGKLEARTGYGGGYMERDEVVEYKERTDSDDEFDEFGRKKKKFRGQAAETVGIIEVKNSSPPAEDDDEDGDMSKYQLDSDEEDDDDDDDDDDDVDLSKYALDDEDLPQIKIIKKPVSRDSRSRSSSSSSSSTTSSSSESRSRSSDRQDYKRNSRRSGSYSRSRSRSRSCDRSGRHRGRKSRSRSRDRSFYSRHQRSRSYSRSRSRSRSRDRGRYSYKHRRRSRSRS